eukprot:507482_1
MGCLTSSSEQTESSSQIKKPLNPNPSITSLKLEQKKEFSFYIQTPPLINGNNAIFLYKYKNGIRYSTFNLNTCKYTSKNQEFKCDDNDNFDPFNSVYTLNKSNNKIYFIVDNKDIKTLDLNTNEIQSLNKSITTRNKNYASITYCDNKVYIFGAEEKSDESDQYTLIKYSTAAKALGANKTLELIRNFGWFSRVIITTENNEKYINIMGGQTEIPSQKEAVYSPNDSVWRYNLTNNKWAKQTHLVGLLHSFGIVNYENKYLLSFGGEEKSKSSIQPTRYVYILALENNNKYGLKQYFWYEIAKLPQNMQYYFHCVYNDRGKVIHLFGYDGKYYTVSMDDIFSRLEDGNFREKNVWTEAGKLAIPTKSKKIKSMGPKKDVDDDSSDESDIEEK